MQAGNSPRRAVRTPGGYMFTDQQITAIQALGALCDYPRDPVECRRHAVAKLAAIDELHTGKMLAWFSDMSTLELANLAVFATESQKRALRQLWAVVADRDTLEAPHVW